MTKNRMAVVRIVDDNDEYRNSEAFMLRMFGYNVVEYVSALSFLEEDNPAIPGCVILDRVEGWVAPSPSHSTHRTVP